VSPHPPRNLPQRSVAEGVVSKHARAEGGVEDTGRGMAWSCSTVAGQPSCAIIPALVHHKNSAVRPGWERVILLRVTSSEVHVLHPCSLRCTGRGMALSGSTVAHLPSSCAILTALV